MTPSWLPTRRKADPQGKLWQMLMKKWFANCVPWSFRVPFHERGRYFTLSGGGSLSLSSTTVANADPILLILFPVLYHCLFEKHTERFKTRKMVCLYQKHHIVFFIVKTTWELKPKAACGQVGFKGDRKFLREVIIKHKSSLGQLLSEGFCGSCF